MLKPNIYWTNLGVPNKTMVLMERADLNGKNG